MSTDRIHVGFLIEGQGLYRLFGPVIEEALRRRAKVSLLLRDFASDRVGLKSYGRADPTQIPAFAAGQPSALVWKSYDALVDTCLRERIHIIMSVWTYPRVWATCRNLRAHSVRWIALQHANEYLSLPVGNFLEPDMTCMYSDYWVEDAIQRCAWEVSSNTVQSSTLPDLRQRLVTTGYPEMDVVSKIDPAKVRRKYGIPSERPVVLWLPHDYHEHDHWEMLIYRRNLHPKRLMRALLAGRWALLPGMVSRRPLLSQLVASLREFCDRNGAFLVVKSRLKDRPSTIEQRAADLFTVDQTYYPATILELLSISDLCLHVMSAVTMEAAYLNVPMLCLYPPPDSALMCDTSSVRGRWLRQSLEPGSLHHFGGVSWLVPISEAPDHLRRARLADFKIDPYQQRAYLEKYVGPTDGHSAARVWQVIERMCR